MHKTWLTISALFLTLAACSNPNQVKQTATVAPEPTIVEADTTPPPATDTAPEPTWTTTDMAGTATLESAGTETEPPRFDSVYFAFDSAVLTHPAREKLSDLRDWLAVHPDEHLMITGHTDDVGTDRYNLELGYERAQVAHRYLIELGVSPDRLQIL